MFVADWTAAIKTMVCSASGGREASVDWGFQDELLPCTVTGALTRSLGNCLKSVWFYAGVFENYAFWGCSFSRGLNSLTLT